MSMVVFMPVLTQSPAARSGSIATYGETVSNWLSNTFHNINMMPVDRSERRRPATDRAKRAIDVAGALLLLAVMLPVIGMIAAAVAATGVQPLYGHQRIGRGGRPFRCWKIRTMVPDAEDRLHAVLRGDAVRAGEWARDHKLRDDPRVTRIGRLLRLSSLDELPQLWNILAGEMSLVGPRPVTRDELGRYGASARHYLAVRPGLTGLWQIDGRNDIPYARRVVLDRAYVMRPSLRRDFALLWRTPLAVARRTGR